MLAELGYSVQAIAELTNRTPTQIRLIARKLGVTSLAARKWRGDLTEADYDDAEPCSEFELLLQRGHAYRGGYPYEIRPAEEKLETHGPVKVFRPGPDGELVLVEVLEVA